MPKPYSQDLRDRVIGAAESGSSARAAGRLFGVSESVAIKWVERRRRTGSKSAKRMGGYKRSALDAHADVVLGLVSECPDMTIEEIRAALRAQDIVTGYSSVRRFFQRHRISLKKNRARQRAGASRRGRGAAKMAAGSAGV